MIKEFSLKLFYWLLVCVFYLLISRNGISTKSSLVFAEDKQNTTCTQSKVGAIDTDLTFSAPPIINSLNQNLVVLKGKGVPDLPVIYQVIANPAGTSGKTPADASGNFSITLDLSSFPDGDIFFTVIQKIDECNELMTSQKSIKKTVPPVPPSFQVDCTSDTQNQVIFNIVGTATDAVSVKFKISDGAHTDLMGTAQVDAQHNFAVNNIDVANFNSPLSVSVASIDENDNVSSFTVKQVNSCLVKSGGESLNKEITIPTAKVSEKKVLLPEAGPRVNWQLILFLLITLVGYSSLRILKYSK